MFIGRRQELESLNNIYNKSGFWMTVIYGRRRIGKSTLIAEFIKNKKAVFYTASKVGAVRNLELFSDQVISVLDPTLSDIKFSSVESVFDFITNRLTDEKLIIVIDDEEYYKTVKDTIVNMYGFNQDISVRIYQDNYEKLVINLSEVMLHVWWTI